MIIDIVSTGLWMHGCTWQASVTCQVISFLKIKRKDDPHLSQTWQVEHVLPCQGGLWFFNITYDRPPIRFFTDVIEEWDRVQGQIRMLDQPLASLFDRGFPIDHSCHCSHLNLRVSHYEPQNFNILPSKVRWNQRNVGSTMSDYISVPLG